MAGARGLLVAGIVVAVLEAVTGVVGVFLLGPDEIAIYLLACAGATAGVTTLAVRLITTRPGGGDDGDSGGGPGGGGEPPPWWPGFERDFWRHVRDRERTPA